MKIDEGETLGTPIIGVLVEGGTSPYSYFIATSGQTISSDSLFKINETSGVISNNVVIDADGLRSVTATSVRRFLRILAVGDSTLSCSIVVAIDDINDNAPTLTQDSFTVTVPENSFEGEKISAEFQVVDADVGVNAFIFGKVLSQEPDDFFRLEQTPSGQVFDLVRTNLSLDYETVRSVRLNMSFSDKGQPSLSSESTVVVEVLNLNDNNVTLDQNEYSFEVPENVPVTHLLKQFVASDADGPATNGDRLRHVFSIFGDDAAKFNIDESSGTLVVAEKLDFEVKQTLTLFVNINDGNNDFTAKVVVNVTDHNDNAPNFGQSSVTVTLPEGHNVRTGKHAVALSSHCKPPSQRCPRNPAYFTTNGIAHETLLALGLIPRITCRVSSILQLHRTLMNLALQTRK